MKNIDEMFVKRFKKFLNQNCKSSDFNLDAYIDDLITQWENSGSFNYELSKFESKDNLTHDFEFTLEELNNLGYGIEED